MTHHESTLLQEVISYIRPLVVALTCLMVSGCIKSSTWYTTDDPTLAKSYDGCHTFGALLSPLASDERIRPTFDASVFHDSMRFRFQFALAPGATFRLLDRDFKVKLPSGEIVPLQIQRFPGGVTFNTEIENGMAFTAPINRYGGWTNGIILFADMKTSGFYPSKLIFETPRFEVSGVIYPSAAVPLHLDSRTGVDFCEG